MSTRYNELVQIELYEFQQPINSCNVTSIAYALTALGYPTTVNQVFTKAKLPVGYVTNDGMTIAETWEAAVRYVEAQNLPVIVECYHFDSDVVTLEAFEKDLIVSLQDRSDILVANFSVKIAHSWNVGGGHYSLIADYNPETKELTIAEVHPKKYGRDWNCPVDRLFNAMVDKDSSSGRARGVLRFFDVRSKIEFLPLDNLRFASRSFAWTRDDVFDRNLLKRCIGHAELSEMGRNVGDIVCIGDCGFGCLVDSGIDVDVDAILQIIEDYVRIFSNCLTGLELVDISHQVILAKNLNSISVDLVKIPPNKDAILELLKTINENVVLCVRMNDNKKVNSSILEQPDPKLEASIFNKGIHNWNSIVALSRDSNNVAILNPQYLVFSRIISVSVDQLIDAVVDTMNFQNQQEIEFIKMERTNSEL